MSKKPLPVSGISGKLKEARSNPEAHHALRQALRSDSRKGVIRLLLREERYLKALAERDKRTAAMFEMELDLRERGYRTIAGTDEVGRGPLCGPVVAAAVILPDRFSGNHLLDDSKKLTESVREEVFGLLMQEAVSFAVGMRTPAEIDRDNILASSLDAMRDAVGQLSQTPDMVLVDGNKRIGGLGLTQLTVIGGDARVRVIAAASIIAKVVRDRLMVRFDSVYPDYQIARNKGYPTASHRRAVLSQGSTPMHRQTFLGKLHE